MTQLWCWKDDDVLRWRLIKQKLSEHATIQSIFKSNGPLKLMHGCPGIFFASRSYLPEIKMGNTHLGFENSSAADIAFNYGLWDQWESLRGDDWKDKNKKNERNFNVRWQFSTLIITIKNAFNTVWDTKESNSFHLLSPPTDNVASCLHLTSCPVAHPSALFWCVQVQTILCCLLSETTRILLYSH